MPTCAAAASENCSHCRIRWAVRHVLMRAGEGTAGRCRSRDDASSSATHHTHRGKERGVRGEQVEINSRC